LPLVIGPETAKEGEDHSLFHQPEWNMERLHCHAHAWFGTDDQSNSAKM